MRGKKTILNTFLNLILQIVAIISGFILPRLILQKYGSSYNGLTTSITQFLSCAILLRSGIGGATRAALYKPLAEKNKDEINSIMKATDLFMKKIGIILGILIIIASIIYPFLVKNEFEYFFTFSLFLIIGISTFIESFFGITYLILLQADQKLWIASIFNIISIVLNVILASVLILHNFSIHIVKLGSAIAFCLYPILLNIYVKKRYNIDLKVRPNNEAISQRWDAFWHQVASFFNTNSGVIILTIFTNMLEVSVYSVYNMIITALRNIVLAFSNGLEAAFGNMIAKNEKNILKENLSIIELIIYSIATFVYVCSFLLIVPFVNVYTNGISDINYLRPEFAYIMIISQFFYSIRIPYQMVIQAAGHYKQTRNGAIFETSINIGISIILSIKFGITGVAIGMLIAMAVRTIQLAKYMSQNIINRKIKVTIRNILISFLESAIIIFIFKIINFSMPSNYIQWIFESGVTAIIAFVIIILGNYIFFKKELYNTLDKLKKIFKPKIN